MGKTNIIKEKIHRIPSDGYWKKTSYSSTGLEIETKDVHGYAHYNFYDDKGRKVRSVDLRDGKMAEWKYDGDNLIQYTDGYGRRWLYEYDENGNKITEIFNDGSYIKYTYDESGRITSQYNSDDNETTTYTYDDIQHTYTEYHKGEVVSTIKYDEHGNKIELKRGSDIYRWEYKNGKVIHAYLNDHEMLWEYDIYGNEIAFYSDGKLYATAEYVFYEDWEIRK